MYYRVSPERSYELRCHYCGTKIGEGEWELGLRNPARTQQYSLADFAIVCRPCNLVKGNMSEGEFRRYLSRRRFGGAHQSATCDPR